jgi:hypothetical protein
MPGPERIKNTETVIASEAVILSSKDIGLRDHRRSLIVAQQVERGGPLNWTQRCWTAKLLQ